MILFYFGRSKFEMKIEFNQDKTRFLHVYIFFSCVISCIFTMSSKWLKSYVFLSNFNLCVSIQWRLIRKFMGLDSLISHRYRKLFKTYSFIINLIVTSNIKKTIFLNVLNSITDETKG